MTNPLSSALLVATAITLPACATLSDPLPQQDIFMSEVIGETILLRTPGAAGHDCIGATASDPVLDQLRSREEQAPVHLEYEELKYPEFTELHDNVVSDRFAVVRGQVVIPWCEDVRRFFWVRGLSPSD